MKKFILALLLISAAVRAEEELDSGRKFIAGIGAGWVAGDGLRLGMKQGKESVELGLGLIYRAENGELWYSTGLRYLHDLYDGRLNDTYAWTGVGVTGGGRSIKRYAASAGGGLGISLHFGLPFHLNLDGGWRVYYDNRNLYEGIQGGLTGNAALVYEW